MAKTTKKGSKRKVEITTEGSNLGGKRVLQYIRGGNYSSGGSVVTLLGTTEDGKQLRVRDTKTQAELTVKFSNIGVPVNEDGTFGTVKAWAKA